MNKQKYASPRQKKRKQKRLIRRFRWTISSLLILLLIGYIGYIGYTKIIRKPFTIALDAGHGGNDSGAVGVIEEVILTEQTTKLLEERLEKDGRFHVVLSRNYGEAKSIGKRNEKMKKAKPDIVLSIHANADELGQGTGFECYPSPPGRSNYESSFAFAQMLSQSMAEAGSTIRGLEGIRYGYYIPNGNGEYIKTIKEANDLTVYDYGTFGVVENMLCPAVLVEQCFITNPQDVQNFAGEEGAKKAAEAYYKSICRYLAIEPSV